MIDGKDNKEEVTRAKYTALVRIGEGDGRFIYDSSTEWIDYCKTLKKDFGLKMSVLIDARTYKPVMRYDGTNFYYYSDDGILYRDQEVRQ